MPRSVYTYMKDKDMDMDPWSLERGAHTPSSSSATPAASRRTSVATTKSTLVGIPAEVLDALHAEGLDVDRKGTVHYAPNSATHPRQRRLARKVYDTSIIFAFEFIVTLLSIAGSAVAPVLVEKFGINRTVSVCCLTTTYMVGQAIGSLIFPPVSESFGVKTIYLLSTFGYTACCFVMALWPTLALVVVSRFAAGAFAAMPAASAGAIENLWDMSSRIFVVHIWIGTAVLGLAVGPAVSTNLILSSLGWKSIFWIGGGITGVLSLLCLGLKESRPSTVLHQRARAVTKRTGFDEFTFEEHDSVPTLKKFLRRSLLLPQRLFFTEPIVMLTSIMASTVYGIVYLFSDCLGIVYIREFGLSAKQTSLVLLPIALGVLLSFLPRIYDFRIAKASRENGSVWEPEHKLFGFYIAAPVLAAALWLFSFTVPPLVHISPWPSIMSIALFGYCVTEFDNVLAGYLTDTYASYAASANASMSFLRCIMSGFFPLFGQDMFKSFGPNIALWILAAFATCFCIVAIVFWLYAKAIRERSPLAEKTWRESQSSEELVEGEKARFAAEVLRDTYGTDVHNN